MIVVASLSAVPQSCRTPLLIETGLEKIKERIDRKFYISSDVSHTHTQVLAGLNDFTLAPAGSKELATPNAMIPKAKREEQLQYQIIRSNIVLVAKSRCMNIQ